MKINEFIKDLSQKISAHDVWLIVEAITKKNKIQLLSQDDIELSDQQKKQLEDWLHKIVDENMPIQYLIGYVPFGDVTIYVEPPILIPRPETENWVYHLIEKLIKLKNQNLSILDIGTGSGCIAIALAKALPNSIIYAVDISQNALNLANKNIEFNKIKNVKLIKSDLFENLKNLKFDLIASNPPYIDEKLFETLDLSVKNWEDKRALIAQDSGLQIIKEIIKLAPDYLKKNPEFSKENIPQLILEIDSNQAQNVSDFLKINNFDNIIIEKDLACRDRTIWANLR